MSSTPAKYARALSALTDRFTRLGAEDAAGEARDFLHRLHLDGWTTSADLAEARVEPYTGEKAGTETKERALAEMRATVRGASE